MAWIYAVTLLRALRWPNDWAEAHWLITYEFGPLKRALAGTLIRPLFGRENPTQDAEWVILQVSSIALILFSAVLLWMGIRICYRSRWSIHAAVVVIAFLTSPYVVMSGHLIGYFDNLLILFTFLACSLVLRGNPGAAGIVIAVGTLVHETILLVGYPTVLFAALVKLSYELQTSDTRRPSSKTLLRHLPLVVFPMAVFAFFFVYHSFYRNGWDLCLELKEYLSHYPFIENDRHIKVAESYGSSFLFYLFDQSPEFASRFFAYNILVRNVLTAGLLLALARLALRTSNSPKYFTWLACSITALPLSLHLIAWDTERIWTFPVIVAFLAVWTLYELSPPKDRGTTNLSAFITSAVMVVLFHILITCHLMDDELEHFTNATRVLWYLPGLAAVAIATLFRQRGSY